MPNPHYRNGANFERRVKARLEEQGWTVFRTAGSHSPADLIALRPSGRLLHCDWDEGIQPRWVGTRVRLVQAKGGTSTMGPKERLKFAQFCAELGAEPWIAERGMKLRRISPTGEYADTDANE